MIGKILKKLATKSTSKNTATGAASAPKDKTPAGPSASGKQKTTGKDSDHRSGHKSARTRNTKHHPAPKAQAPEWDISQFPVPEVEGKVRFHDLYLDPRVMHAIADLGFEYCSPIQGQSLPFALKGHDVLGKAQTGTGKTAAFLIAIISDLLKNPIKGERFAGEARALIIAPTRELVIQIAEDAKLLVKHTDLTVHTLVGGMDYEKQQKHLQNDLVDILVATPGRLLDFCGNRDVHLDEIEFLVIDEADRMLDMGFIPQVKRIVRAAPPKTHRQTLLFSATFTQDVLNLAEQWMLNAVTVEIESTSITTDMVEQHIYLAATDEKFTMLYNILHQDDVESMILFANRRDECRRLHAQLEAHGFKAGLLSGEIAQNRRVKTLDAFKSGAIKVLVATDVAGRGIHIDGISHVVNFTLPDEPEDYVHRIGRTGRAGKNGISISFACEDDAFRLMPIQEMVGDKLKCEQPPEHLLVPEPKVHVPREKRDASRSSGNNNRHSSSRGRSGGRR